MIACIVSGRAMNEADSRRTPHLIVHDHNLTETTHEVAEVVSLTALKDSVFSLHDLGLVLDPKAPLDIARQFVQRHHFQSGVRTLHHQNGTFYAWSGRHYPEADPAQLRADIYEFLDSAFRSTGENRVRFKPKRTQVNDVLDALKAVVTLDLSHHAPTWLGPAPVPASEIVACHNGLLHLPSGEILSHTPEFFCHNALEFDFDPGASAPSHWFAFLKELWPDDADADSLATLQEISGLCLTGDTCYQKAFMLIGPRRSGKGTIGRVLTELVGRDSVVAPTLSSMGEQFGPASLIGKRVAIISDARINKSARLDRISERLLSITGEDTQTIDRKFLIAWTGRLQVRFIVLTNEVPEFEEGSSALAGRFIILQLMRSFYGQEDLGLSKKLLNELPGILNWSIAGWQRLTERGHFIQPRSGIGLVEMLESLSSPIMAFVKECCVVGSDKIVEIKRLYNEYRAWNEENSKRSPLPSNLFGRNLYAAVPGLSVMQPRGADGKQVRMYSGIGLRW
jgi:putative DNA primase/helicase